MFLMSLSAARYAFEPIPVLLVATIIALGCLDPVAVASPVRVVALDASVALPHGWTLVEDLGPRGCAFQAPDGSRVEVVTWELSAPEADARHVAWEHRVLLQRSCGFRTSREEETKLPWGAQAVRVLGTTNEDGYWSGVFLAFVAAPGKGCVIGSFVPGAGKIQQAEANLAQFAAALELSGGRQPILAATAARVKLSFLPGALQVVLPQPGQKIASKEDQPARVVALKPLVVASPFFGPAVTPTAGQPTNPQVVSQSVRLACVLGPSMPAADTCLLVSSERLTSPAGTPATILAAMAQRETPTVPSSLAAVTEPTPGHLTPAADDTVYWVSEVPPEVTDASRSSRPVTLAAMSSSTSPSLGPSPPKPTRRLDPVLDVADSRRTMGPPFLWALSPTRLRLDACAAGVLVPGPCEPLRTVNPRGSQPLIPAATVHLVPEVTAEWARVALAGETSAAGQLAGASRISRPVQMVELSDSHSSRSVQGLTTAVASPIGPAPRDLCPRVDRPGLTLASVGTTSYAGGGLGAPASPDRAAVVSPVPTGRQTADLSVAGVLSKPPTGPLSSAADSRPQIPPQPTAAPAPPLAPAPSSPGGVAVTVPARSAPTAGWVEDDTASLHVPVPLGWKVTAHVLRGPSGPALLVEGTHSADPASSFCWAQPALPAYRELSPLLITLGYREWQTYPDPKAGDELTVANRRQGKRFLEDVVLSGAGCGLVGWQILDAQPSDLSGGLLPSGEGLVAHVLGTSSQGSREGWYAVATGQLPDLPHYVWAGAWLAAQSRPGHREALEALAYVVRGANATGDSAPMLEALISSAQRALDDLLRAGLAK